MPLHDSQGDLGFEREMPGMSAEGKAVEVVTPAQEGLKRAKEYLNRIRKAGPDAMHLAIEDANQPNVDPKDTEVIDLAGIVDATESTQAKKIIAALKTADNTNPTILADAFFEAVDGGVDPSALENVAERIDAVENSPEARANYQGNWMQLQQDRMESADFKEKFDAWMQRDELSAAPRRPTHITADQLATRRADFPQNTEKVYVEVGYAPAEQFGKKPAKLGISFDYGEPGVVFSDAMQDGVPLTGRQKDIISAHEAHHALILPQYDFQAEIRKGLDHTKLGDRNAGNPEGRKSYNYFSSGHEVIARMAQLKNYYGMKDGEVFTAAHLDYARDHYVLDTGLDNSMTEFFLMVTPDTTSAFVNNMNTMPV